MLIEGLVDAKAVGVVWRCLLLVHFFKGREFFSIFNHMFALGLTNRPCDPVLAIRTPERHATPVNVTINTHYVIQTISILGVGLMGGSLGLAWKKNRPALTCIGYDRADVMEAARQNGIIDREATSVADAVRDADLVVVATPLGAMPTLFEAMAPHLKPGAVVTDVGSVKAGIMADALRLLPEGISFIGGHPMAGAEHRGVAHADALLFENATYVLCPPVIHSVDEFIERHADLIDLIQLTGARILVLNAKRHDRIAAAVSHVPQLVSIALIHLADPAQTHDPAYLKLAAGGFRDMTRIASSPFGIWQDILAANHTQIVATLGMLIRHLERQRTHLQHIDITRLEADFTAARAVRRTIPPSMKGFLRPLADVYVYAEDRPGYLAQLTRLLYEADLNIKDLELLKIREGTGGAFKVGFADEADADRAVAVLVKDGYTAYRL